MDEERELISQDFKKEQEFCEYCQCTKILSNYECSCSSGCLCVLIGAPFALIYDILAFIPQCSINNVLLFKV